MYTYVYMYIYIYIYTYIGGAAGHLITGLLYGGHAGLLAVCFLPSCT